MKIEPSSTRESRTLYARVSRFFKKNRCLQVHRSTRRIVKMEMEILERHVLQRKFRRGLGKPCVRSYSTEQRTVEYILSAEPPTELLRGNGSLLAGRVMPVTPLLRTPLSCPPDSPNITVLALVLSYSGSLPAAYEATILYCRFCEFSSHRETRVPTSFEIDNHRNSSKSLSLLFF